MSTIRFSTRLMSLGVASLAVMVFIAVRPAPIRADDLAKIAAPSKSLDALRQERIDTLHKASQRATQMYNQGIGSSDPMFAIGQSLIEAELDAASSGKQRIELLQEALKLANDQENIANQRETAGLVAPLDALRAKAYRLQVEIELAKETAK